MSASQAPALDAVALQLARALEDYEAATAAMVAAWPDMELYRSVSGQVERIRMYSGALPALSVQWVELLIAHAELVHLLWQTQYGKAATDSAQVTVRRERHSGCVRALRSRCLSLAGEASQLSPAGDAGA